MNIRQRAALPLIILIASVSCSSFLSAHVESAATLTILYDNNQVDSRLRAHWGFSCLIAGTEKTILFDTGANSSILSFNADRLCIDLRLVDVLALSHAHADHCEGFGAIPTGSELRRVCVPSGFRQDVLDRLPLEDAEVEEIDGLTELCQGVFLTGPVGSGIAEQAIVIDASDGLVIVTGCAHLGIVSIVETIQANLPNRPIALLVGGFHLLQEDEAAIEVIARRLQELGVQEAGPTHCSGDLARTVFRQVFEESYLDLGVGTIIGIAL